MPVDEAQAGATTLPEATATPTEAQPEAPNPDDAFWARLLEADPDEVIRRSAKLQGKVGALAQQQSQRVERDYQNQIAQAREATRIAEQRATNRRLAEHDPDALAAKVLADEAMAEFQENQARLLEAQRGEMSRVIADRLDKFQSKPVFAEVWAVATPEQREKLTWGNYREIDDFFEAAAEIIADHRSEKKAESLAAKRLEALRKEANIEGVKAEATNGKADLNLDGLSGAEHIFSEAEITANIGDAAWRKANISRINQQAAAGLIRMS